MELQGGDINLIAEDAALADDRVLAEILRLRPFDDIEMDGPTKAILSYSEGPIAIPSGADARLKVFAFRPIVASDKLPATDPTANWRDIRSVIVVGFSPNNYQSQFFAANSSGFDRWDLLYCRMDKDLNEAAVNRYVKSGTTETLTSVINVKRTTAILGIKKGTASATPALPDADSDTSTTFYIPICYVYIPDGFNATSIILPEQIYEAIPIVNISRVTGACSARVANAQYEPEGAVISTDVIADWGTARPEVYMPPSMMGEETRYISLNLQDAASANWSQEDDSIVDDTVNWSNRLFSWTAQVDSGGSTRFAWNVDSGTNVIPKASTDALGTTQTMGFGQSTCEDEGSTSVVCLLNNDNMSAISTGEVSLYVDTDGVLRMTTNSTVPAVRVFVRLCASAPFANR